MDRQPVKSSIIHTMGYDPESETLEIQFKGSGNIYQYPGFSEIAWQNFNNAESIGSYFARYIRPQYQSKLVGQEKPSEAQTPQAPAEESSDS